LRPPTNSHIGDFSGHLAVDDEDGLPETGTMNTKGLETADAAGEIAGLSTDAFLSMLLDRTADGIMLTDSAGVIVYANQPLLQMFGYDDAALIGQPVDILLPEYLRQHHRHQVEGFIAAPRPRSMGRDDLDLEGRRADGSVFSIDVQLNTMPESALVVATIRDMTAQRRASVDHAIGKIDLSNAKCQVDRLQTALDLVIQRLFALGLSITASASDERMLAERLATALHGIDQIIDTIQETRQTVGP
jgi:PAS domain S-box-containing protein